MKKILVLAAMVAATMSSLGQVTQASLVLANWTFETSVPTTSGPHAAEAGLFAATSFASGSHADPLTSWTNPAGNGVGSIESFSSNRWAVGDYYQFTTSTLGFENIVFTWDQTGSNTGPRDFILQYDAGMGIVEAFEYSISNQAWNTSTYFPESTRSFNFSAISALNDLASVTFRLTMASNVAINGGTVATAGTGRVDNILISATAIPEPSAFLLMGSVLGFGALRRRRS